MYFDEVKKNFGFGCMRLPMIENGKAVDIEQIKKMVDTFIEQGFNYFDTAHGYLEGKSELALKECLTSRHKREEYILTDKLTMTYFNKQEDIRPFFESQLEACGVEYFDFYLMHSQSKDTFEHFKKCRAYETALELKKEGKIHHFGISFHDKAEVLEEILKEYPQIEVVQIQFNYLDYEDPAVQSRKCYEVCRRYNKPVIVMEPVKGGNLVNLPDDAAKILDNLNGGSAASYAVRFAASFEGVMMVLSGMSNMEQLMDNMSYMKDFKPLNNEEQDIIMKAVDAINSNIAIPCTGCSYCTEGCPMKIAIPKYFSLFNADLQEVKEKGWTPQGEYYDRLTHIFGKASDCVACGQCEKACPQHLSIIEDLKKVAEYFGK